MYELRILMARWSESFVSIWKVRNVRQSKRSSLAPIGGRKFGVMALKAVIGHVGIQSPREMQFFFFEYFRFTF